MLLISKRFTKMFGLLDRFICFVLFILMILAILYEVAIYHIGLITGNYYKILNQKDYHAFLGQTLKSIAFIIVISLLKSLKEYVASYLYVIWRKYLTSQLHKNYFQNMAFFRLNVLNDQKINKNNVQNNSANIKTDNVDQRITQDVDKMFHSLSMLIPELLVSPFIIIFYWYKCQQASGWVGPISCLTMFFVGSIVNLFLIQKVSHYVYAQERCEGNFRFQHLRIRNNAEAIAFMSGQSVEQCKCEYFLTSLISAQQSLIFRQFLLKFSAYISDYFGAILSFVALGFPLFAGKYDNLTNAELSQLISQNAFFTMYLINCFTRLIDLSTNFSTFLGTYRRIKELNQWFESNSIDVYRENRPEVFIENNRTYQTGMSSNSLDDQNEQCYFKMKGVSIKTPLGGDIVNNFNLIIKPHVNLFITGPSGVGKTSILRTLKGIWPLANGIIERNLQIDSPSLVMFLSQKPILTTGSVAEQIIYPNIYNREVWLENEGFRRIVLDILNFLDLEKSVLKLVNYDIHRDLNLNWIDYLSDGEAQRFNLARIFYHRPKIVFLDESTTSLPEEIEEIIIEELLNRYLVTIVSCGHRQSLKRYHQMELRIHNNHQFELNYSSKL